MGCIDTTKRSQFTDRNNLVTILDENVQMCATARDVLPTTRRVLTVDGRSYNEIDSLEEARNFRGFMRVTTATMKWDANGDGFLVTEELQTALAAHQAAAARGSRSSRALLEGRQAVAPLDPDAVGNDPVDHSVAYAVFGTLSAAGAVGGGVGAGFWAASEMAVAGGSLAGPVVIGVLAGILLLLALGLLVSALPGESERAEQAAEDNAYTQKALTQQANQTLLEAPAP